MTSFHRGHVIAFAQGSQSWIYLDTGSSVADDPYRRCGHCDEPNTPEGHDPCLGTLPNVMNACCGHGVEADAYVQSLDGTTTTGRDALRLQSAEGVR